jgi:hypothetical protein
MGVVEDRKIVMDIDKDKERDSIYHQQQLQ